MEERRRVPEDAEWVKQLARRGAYLSLLDRCGDRPQLRRLVWRHTLSPDNATMKYTWKARDHFFTAERHHGRISQPTAPPFIHCY